ncbi:MAG: hypothetical protein JNK82_24800 [Myxococcaceae bacterium]|nr:hypothetical protein [Myxococcaceae bacterium]
MRTRSRVLVAALLASTTAAAAPARVTLIERGDEARTATFRASLRELLERLDVTIDATEGPALAAVEADFTEPGARLTIVDGAGREVLVRRMAPASPSLQAEAAAHVVQAIIEELLTAAAAPPPRSPEPPRPVARPMVQTIIAPAPNAPEDTRRFGIDLGGFFGGKALGGPPATFGGGLDVALAYRVGGFRPGLHLRGGYDAPFTVEGDWLDLRVSAVPLRALVSLDVLSGDAWRLEAALGGGADLFVTSAAAAQLPPHRLKPGLSPAPVLSALVGGHVALASSVDVHLALAADVDLRPPRFITDDRREVFTPWRVRPSLVLGFSFNVLGPDPYRHGIGAAP